MCREDSQKDIDREVFEVVKTITAVDIKEVSGKERGEVTMWTALKEWQQESYESGEKSARRQLITQMLKNQWSAEAIHEATAIPLEEIKKVQETVCF